MYNLTQLEEQVKSALKLARRMLQSYREDHNQAATTQQAISQLTFLEQEIKQLLNSPEVAQVQLESLSLRIREQIAELDRLNYSDD